MLFVLVGVGSAGAAVEPPAAMQITPPRLGYVEGEVLFWRPGAGDWERAQVNMPLAPGDALATREGKLELQIGGKSFVRAAEGTQFRVVDNEPNFLHLEVSEGHVAVDLRDLRRSAAVEVDTPNSAITLAQDGYYRIDVAQTTQVVVRRGGLATVRPAGGTIAEVGTGEAVEITGTNTAQLAALPAPGFDEWDRWNYERGEAFVAAPRSYAVSSDVYGTEELERNGSWRYANTYGRVWVPNSVPAGWAPYTYGRWAWDPLYGYSWVDYAPWGWAPYHYGRWVYPGYWAWAPGPVLAAPFYSPALVAFFGVPGFSVGVSVGFPAVSWVPLGWGEPLIPWWGPVGFIGSPCWWGWGGPRVVNNVVINNNTVVNANTVNFYRNFNSPGGLVGVPKDQFTSASLDRARLQNISSDQLKPLHGALPIAAQGATAGSGGAPAKLNMPAFHGQQAASAAQGGATNFSRGQQAVTGAARAQSAADTKLGSAFDALRGGGNQALQNGTGKAGAPSVGSANLQRGQPASQNAGAKVGFGALRNGGTSSTQGTGNKAGMPTLGSNNLQRGSAPPALPNTGSKMGSGFGGLRSGSTAPSGSLKQGPSNVGTRNLQRGSLAPPLPGDTKVGSSFGGLRRGQSPTAQGNFTNRAPSGSATNNLRRADTPPALPSGTKSGSSFGGLRAQSGAPAQGNLNRAAPAPRVGNMQRGQAPPSVSSWSKDSAPAFGGLRGQRNAAPSGAARLSAPTTRYSNMARNTAPPLPRGGSKPSSTTQAFQRSAPSQARQFQRNAPAQARQYQRRAPAPSVRGMTASRGNFSRQAAPSAQRYSAPSRAAAPAPSVNARSFSRSMGGAAGGSFSSMSRGFGGGGSNFSRSMGGGASMGRSIGGGSGFGRSMGGGGKLGR